MTINKPFNNVSDKTRPEYVMVIGIPCSGKSTLYHNKYNTYCKVSSDDYIERECAKIGITYSEGFKKFVKAAGENMNKVLEYAFAHNLNIFHDQTNMSVAARKPKLAKIPANYKKVAIVVSTNWDKVLTRNAARSKATGKHIPIDVLTSMKNSYEIPTKAEGFEDIIFITN